MVINWLYLVGSWLIATALAAELTFELPDKEKMCFYEHAEKGIACRLEFQVVKGGSYDIDLEVTDEKSGKVRYKEHKKQYDSITWTAEETGEFKFCFSNTFSTFTHKVVYFDLMVGDEKPLKPDMQQAHTMTLMETSAVTIHESLKMISDYQTHHRLREMGGRSHAEDLNGRVMFGSVVEFVCILLIGITQVLVVRSFFSDKKNRGSI